MFVFSCGQCISYDLSCKLQKNGFSVWQNVASFENFMDENTGKKYAIMI